MWRVTLPLVLIFLVNAFARTAPIRQFIVQKANYSRAHVQTPTTGVLTVDYETSFVQLDVSQAMPACPADLVCAQVMPEPLSVRLPITSVQRGNCGIYHVIAEQDFRPNDGPLERIELDDTTEMNCAQGADFTANATYETRLFDRTRRQTVSNLSKMVITPAEDQFVNEPGDRLTFVKGTFLKGFPSYQFPGGGSLLIAEDKIQMKIDVHMDCKDRICPRMIPLPLYTELPIVSTESTECGKILTARKDQRAIDGTLEELKINFQSNANCNPSQSDYTEVRYHSFLERSSGPVEYEASFSFARL